MLRGRRTAPGRVRRVSARATKYVFVTGGVVSSLGKGITAASLGALLKARGLRVQVQKFDPYINVDPGTMSPYQHGEVFVTEDGAETDLDIGHYERFVDENLSRNANHTSGSIWYARHPQGAQGRVPRLHRPGDPAHHERDQGPHPPRGARCRTPTSSSPRSAAPSATSSRCPFLEAIRQFRREEGAENVIYIHVTLVPFIDAAGELKTKPTQHSVNELRRIGIHPDIVVCRSRERALARHPGEDRALRRHRHEGGHLERATSSDVYLVPAALHDGGSRRAGRARSSASAARQRTFGSGTSSPSGSERGAGEVEIALVGKYVKVQGRLPVRRRGAEARRASTTAPASRSAGSTPRGLASRRCGRELERADGILVPGGFGGRGIEGKMLAARVAREQGIPYLGICLGHAGRGRRVRSARVRPGRGELERVRSARRPIP